MNKMYIHQQPSATTIHRAIAQREVSAEGVLREAIARIEELEPTLHAWKILDTERALQVARQLDARIAQGDTLGLLTGIPLAVKDILDTSDMPTGYGSVVYEGHKPITDAAVVHTVKEAGAIIVGKTVTTEFAYFTPGPTVNPWNTSCTPGGSSSGSAAAVASGMVPLAFGTQTAGSLIRPASYCGVFAIKPTHDLISTAGAKAFAPSLDTMGWLANSAQDLELMRAALQGITFERLPDATGLSLASCQTHEWAFMDASGQFAWDVAHHRLSLAGTPITTLKLPEALSGLLQAQKTVMAYEAAQNLSLEADQWAIQISRPILELVSAGRAIQPENYDEAKRLADHGRRKVLELMGDADALLVPAAPGEAPLAVNGTGDPVFSRVWTLLGLPCINVPGLLGPNGMPVGVQLVGRPNQERRLLAVAEKVHTILID